MASETNSCCVLMTELKKKKKKTLKIIQFYLPSPIVKATELFCSIRRVVSTFLVLFAEMLLI